MTYLSFDVNLFWNSFVIDNLFKLQIKPNFKMACKICNYEGLTGIVVGDLPSAELVCNLPAHTISQVVKIIAKSKYLEEPKGIATTFWGHEATYLGGAVIVDLSSEDLIAPTFNCDQGSYVPAPDTHSSCGGLTALTAPREVVLRQKAMNELLSQAAKHLNGHPREGHYFMLTHFDKGCCNFKAGTIDVSLAEFENLVQRYLI